MEKHSLEVSILGTTFTIQSENEPGHLEGVVTLFKDRVQEVQRNTRITDPLKISLLAGLNIIDELMRLKREQIKTADAESAESMEIQRITEQIIDRINRSLMGN